MSPAAQWSRPVVTCAAAAIVWGLDRIRLPGLDADALGLLMQGGAASPGILSVGALGVAPLVSAFVIVELAAVAVPRWRGLRIGGPAERARLRAAALRLAFVLALVQGTLTASVVEGMRTAQGLPVVGEPGLAFRAVVVVTLVAATALLAWIAEIVERVGLGAGYSVVVGTGVLASVLPDVLRLGQAFEVDLVGGQQLIFILGGLATAVFATWHVSDGPGASRSATAGAPLRLRVPASGVAPIDTAASLLVLPATVGALTGSEGGRLADALQADQPTYALAHGALMFVICVLYSWLFNRPERVSACTRVAGPGPALSDDEAARTARRALVGAVARSVVFLTVLLAASNVVGHITTVWLDVVGLAVLTAVFLDLRAEWRARRQHTDLVTVWPVHRVYAVDPILRALRDAGIYVHPRGLRHRVLLQFFGPYVGVDLMVPAGQEAAARALLQQQARRPDRRGVEPLDLGGPAAPT